MISNTLVKIYIILDIDSNNPIMDFNHLIMNFGSSDYKLRIISLQGFG